MFNKFFTTINSLNQAIQPRVVGPLFKKGCIDFLRAQKIQPVVGTSIDLRLMSRGTWALFPPPAVYTAAVIAPMNGTSLTEPYKLWHCVS